MNKNAFRAWQEDVAAYTFRPSFAKYLVDAGTLHCCGPALVVQIKGQT